MKITTHYDNLQVARNASPAVIRAAYKSLIQRYHPDRNPNDLARYERIMKIINHAYDVLSDPAQRREHDAWVAREELAQAANVPGADVRTEPVRSRQPAAQRPPQPQDGTALAASYAAAAETFRTSRTDVAATKSDIDERARAAPLALHPSGAPLIAPSANSNTRGHDGGRMPQAVASSGDVGGAPKPAGFLYALIVLLKFGGLLTGLALYGQLTSLDVSIRPEFADAWGSMKLQLWLVWGIAVVAYFVAGHLLASRNVSSTRWEAAALIWAGAIAAPLVGLLIAPVRLPHELAVKMPAYYVPQALRAVLFASACTLYLSFSRRVKRTYLAAAQGTTRRAAGVNPSGANTDKPAQREHAKKQAAERAREYASNAAYSAIFTLILWSQAHPEGRSGLLPPWALGVAGVGVWIVGAVCVGFVVAALATKWGAYRE